jgi:N-acetylmuramoyl-L-alanine amidase
MRPAPVGRFTPVVLTKPVPLGILVPVVLTITSLVLLLFPCAAQCAVTVENVRHWTAPDHTRIVIDLSGQPKYRQLVLSDPPRILVEIAKAKLRPSVTELVVNDGVVAKVRMSPSANSVVQIIVDLTGQSESNVFYLNKLRDKPHRIVIDVKKSASAAPAPARAPSEGVPPPVREKKKQRVVVIDPGHGGEDPGAVGWGALKEKDICLKVARELKARIDAVDGMKAHLTRNGDYFLPLRKRTRIAKDLDADVFVSIHMNASRNRGAFGTEVFFLSLTGATDEAARDLADRENAADLVGGIPPETEEDIVSILMDLKQSNALAKSSELAERIIDSLGRHKRLVTRGVKQAGFTVLKSADFPSVLVEIAFISNKSEAALLKADAFHDEISSLLTDALRQFCGVYASLGSAASAGAR